MRGLQNCGGRGNSYAKLVEAEPEPVARATPPYDYLEHTEEGKQEKFHHGLCTSYGGAKARLAPGSFYPSTDRDRENGQITRQLGDSLYSAFILIWMNKSSNSNWHTLWFAVKTGLVVSLLASHYAQLSFAYYLINSIRQSHDSGYCAGDDYTPVLKMLAVISFLSLCFGDLHLEHIRGWREEALSSLGADLHFPLWHADYEELSADLRASGVPCDVSATTVDTVTVGQRFGEFETPHGLDAFGERGEFHTLARVWEVPRRAALGV